MILAIVGACAVTAEAAFGVCCDESPKADGGPYKETVDGVEWTFNVSNGVSRVGFGGRPAISAEISGDLKIPTELGGHQVAAIDANAFSGCWRLKSILIPEGVLSIGAAAFEFCQIHQFDLPCSLKRFDITAFDFYSDKVSSVSVHSNVEVIEGGKGWFYTTIYADSGDVDRIRNLFASHVSPSEAIEAIRFVERKPNGGPYTEKLGYREWTWTFEVVQGNAVITSADSVGGDDCWLPSMLGGRPVTEIADQALCLSVNVVSMLIPEGVVKIGESAFEGCSRLESVILPTTLKSIGFSAFCGCSKLTNVKIPDSVTTIGACAFMTCGLTKVELPADLSAISDAMFYGCSKLTCVNLPKGVTTIGAEAFFGCTSLETVEIRKGVKSIEEYAFFNCGKLKTICVERGDEERVKELLGTSGVDVSKLQFETLKYDDGTGYVDIVDGCEWEFSVGNGESYVERVTLPTGVTSVIVPAKLGGRPVVSIGCEVFVEKEITSVSIPEGVVKIGAYAFEHCEALSSISLPSSLKEIDHHAFRYCTSLKEIEIPDGVARIGYRAFNCFDYDCIDESLSRGVLEKVSLPKGLTCLGDEVFSGTPYGESLNAKAILMVDGKAGDTTTDVSVVSTNVVIHYVLNSVQPQFAVPAAADTGFVNIIAEVKGGAVAVPASWAENYPNFIDKFGSDFTKALTKKTGKKDGAGNDMLVWQDYVAGTDPTDENDVFRASITVVDGKVTISWTPELDAERAVLRKYTTWGKKSLMDADWAEVPAGSESEFNFFKVSVEMR